MIIYKTTTKRIRAPLSLYKKLYRYAISSTVKAANRANENNLMRNHPGRLIRPGQLVMTSVREMSPFLRCRQTPEQHQPLNL